MTDAEGANSTHCQPSSAVPRPPNRRSPEPSSTGTTTRWSSSSSPARRYSRTVETPPPRRTCASPADARARTRAASMPSATKWKVVPPAMTTGSRGWWVSTKTSWWKGDPRPTSRPSPTFPSPPGPARTCCGPSPWRRRRPRRGCGSAGPPRWPRRRRSTRAAAPRRSRADPARSGPGRPRSRRVRGRSCAPGARPCGDDRGRQGNSSVLPGAGRRWMRTRAVPYTGATGAADPATGVPRNLSEASRCRGEAGGPGPRPGQEVRALGV